VALALITGGAGFIGSHLADRLLALGYRVRVLDSLIKQVHPTGRRPAYLTKDVELSVADVRDAAAVSAALDGVDYVFHLAALVGVGQSMYRIADYTDVNVRGTAVLLEQLAQHRPAKLVVASSMSVYGEGACRNEAGELVQPAPRSLERLKRGDWELRDEAGDLLVPVPTTEEKPPVLESIYALTKFDQERLCLITGRAYGIPTVALRFFNVYGPRQALSNPYTGVLAIFSSRLLNDRPPMLFEDGRQRRDFVSVHDVVNACVLALRSEKADSMVFNVGSGRPRSVLEVAASIAGALDKRIEPEVTGKYRVGDIRHCFADIERAHGVLGYQPSVDFARGIAELASYLRGQTRDVAQDRVLEARRELDARGLTL
jgi:dTDP-L-rhamnose 4-epimerase